MIILDTNVLSAVMQKKPDPVILDWLDNQVPADLWLSSVTVFETSFGIQSLPAGSKRNALQNQFEQLVLEDFGGRVAGLDFSAAQHAATLASKRKRKGKGVDFRDTLIAGIVISRAASLATRNVRHFDDLPVPVINPWDSFPTT